MFAEVRRVHFSSPRSMMTTLRSELGFLILLSPPKDNERPQRLRTRGRSRWLAGRARSQI